MKFEQLGIITFFGILIPGAYLTAFLVLTFACVLELNSIHGHTKIFSFLSKNSLLSTSVFVFMSYLFGVVVRLFAAGVIDNISTTYLKFIPRKKAKFRITEQSLQYLKSEKVPDNVLNKLKNIKEQEFKGEKRFLDVLKTTISVEQAENYKSKILKHTRKDKKQKEEEEIYGDWITDPFPYQETIMSEMEYYGMAEVPHLIARLNKKYEKKGNQAFFNYCKSIIEANNETIAKHMRENEALIRFLSGTSLALIMSCVLGLLLSLIFLFRLQILFFQLYMALTLVSLIILAGILARFKYQRRREVVFVWKSMYLLLKGGIPNALGIPPDELTKRVTLEIDPDSIPHGSSDDDQTIE